MLARKGKNMHGQKAPEEFLHIYPRSRSNSNIKIHENNPVKKLELHEIVRIKFPNSNGKTWAYKENAIKNLLVSSPSEIPVQLHSHDVSRVSFAQEELSLHITLLLQNLHSH